MLQSWGRGGVRGRGSAGPVPGGAGARAQPGGGDRWGLGRCRGIINARGTRWGERGARNSSDVGAASRRPAVGGVGQGGSLPPAHAEALDRGEGPRVREGAAGGPWSENGSAWPRQVPGRHVLCCSGRRCRGHACFPGFLPAPLSPRVPHRKSGCSLVRTQSASSRGRNPSASSWRPSRGPCAGRTAGPGCGEQASGGPGSAGVCSPRGRI